VLSGRPTLAAPGDLTITAVGVEAQLKRHHLTHKHTDLKDLFYQLRDNHANPLTQSAAAAAAEVNELKEKLSDACEGAAIMVACARSASSVRRDCRQDEVLENYPHWRDTSSVT